MSEHTQPIVPRAEILTWRCQHGTLRRGYVKPVASCVKRAVTPCQWTEKEASNGENVEG